MFNANPVNQQRRKTGLEHLSIDASAATNNNVLPPLKSPRGHLLDRIRSTPRSAKFVPHNTPLSSSSDVASVAAVARSARSDVSSGSQSAGQRRESSSGYDANTEFRRTFKVDPAQKDQMALLEQRLRAQNDLLVQQQMLLQQLQMQQVPTYYATPPGTPQMAGTQRWQVPQASNVVYDPATGQYYMFGQQTQHAQYEMTQTAALMTPPAKQQQQNYTLPPTPESMARSSSARSATPPKDGQPTRQPKGPPAIELLVADKQNNINFGNRTRRKATKLLEAGLLRRRNSPGPEIQRAASRASLRSEASHSSLGPIEEAFPAIEIS